jgi:hypothetical protein
MKRVYVAGKLNDDAIGYIKNMHRMIKTARELRKEGFAVYVPCNDFLEGLVDGDFSYKEYFDNSQPWLEASDALFLSPGWETSMGTQREIARARECNIPIFKEMKNLIDYFYADTNKD